MYFWKDKELAKRLHENAVSQKEQMKYFLIFSVLSTLLTTAIFNFNIWHAAEQLTISDYATDITMIAFAFASVLICYRVNAHGDNADFIARWICLSLPVSIRTLAVGFCLMIIALIITGLYDADISPSLEELKAMTEEEINQIEFSAVSDFILFLVIPLSLLYFLRRISTAFKIASGQT